MPFGWEAYVAALVDRKPGPFGSTVVRVDVFGNAGSALPVPISGVPEGFFYLLSIELPDYLIDGLETNF
jgi:hypothetical protein